VNEFVSDFQDLFGAIHMTLNPHLLKHIIKIVRAWGPVSCYSTFCFESGNGRLRKFA